MILAVLSAVEAVLKYAGIRKVQGVMLAHELNHVGGDAQFAQMRASCPRRVDEFNRFRVRHQFRDNQAVLCFAHALTGAL